METVNPEQEISVSDEENQPGLSSSNSQQNLDEVNADDQTTNDTNATSKKKKTGKTTTKKPKQKIIFNVSDTRYEVVKYVGRKLMGYKLTKEPEVEWDIFWTDNAVQPETLARMQHFQKINHFPGMYSLARKNHLGRNLMRMKKAFPQNFKFFPQTYLLPAEYSEFRSQFSNKSGGAKTFIVKPEASCQGRGIFLTRSPDAIQPGEHYVVQRYLQKPFLLDGLKFDLRIYVLLCGTDPLRIYLYDEGLGRFATEEYVAPTANNMDNMCMHLTNYAINKDNPNFVFNENADDDNVGHKRGLKAVMKDLEARGHDVKKLWNDIKKIIIKTFCSVQPILAHNYKSCQPEDATNSMCFEILGFDIMLDHKLKPWLIEVNHTPSFTTDTPLDKAIKRGVIKDSLTIMNISVENRNKYKNKKKAELQQRVLTGKKAKLTLEEKQAACEKAQKERDAWESSHLGGFEKIYPIDNPDEKTEDYEEFMRVAYQWWQDWTGTNVKKHVKKVTSNQDSGSKPSTASAPVGQTVSSFGGSNRAKEIQNVYTQKMKIGTAGQKTRKAAGLLGSGNKQPDVPTMNSPNSQPVVQETKLDKELENIRAWEEVVAEDDAEDLYAVPGVMSGDEEEEDLNKEEKKDSDVKKGLREIVEGVEIDDKIEKAQNQEKAIINQSASRSSLQTDSTMDVGNTPDTSKPSSFRIKKGPALTTSGLGASLGNIPSRITPSKGDKENEKAQFFKPSLVNNPQKLSNIYSGVTSKFLTKLSDKPDSSQETQKPVLRTNTATMGTLGYTDITIPQRGGATQEKKVRSANNLDLQTIGQSKSDKTASKKSTLAAPLSQQKITNNGNFVTPRLFEMNFQPGSKEEAQPSKGSLIGGPLYSTLKGMGKNPITHSGSGRKEIIGQAMASGNNPDLQMSLQKLLSYPTESKK